MNRLEMDRETIRLALAESNEKLSLGWDVDTIERNVSLILMKIDTQTPQQLDGILALLEHNFGKPEDFSDIIFDDEIIEIVESGTKTTIDIEVSDDHLYYANGLLTHNSAYGNIDAGLESVADSLGIIQTADTAVLFIQNDQMKEMNQMIWKFAKNRNTGSLDNVMVKTDFPKMRFSDWDGDGEVNDSSVAVMNQGINNIQHTMPDLGLNNPANMIGEMDVGQLKF